MGQFAQIHTVGAGYFEFRFFRHAFNVAPDIVVVVTCYGKAGFGSGGKVEFSGQDFQRIG